MKYEREWKMELAKASCEVWKSRVPRDCDDCYGPEDCPMKIVLREKEKTRK
jgi:hypothetical protein